MWLSIAFDVDIRKLSMSRGVKYAHDNHLSSGSGEMCGAVIRVGI